MFEHITYALVLNFYITNENDKNIILFTEKFGKIKARAKGGGKILSRLSPHLDIGNLVQVRIIEKNMLTLVDALTIETFYTAKQNQLFFSKMLAIFYFLNKVIPEGVPDESLFKLIIKQLQNAEANIKAILNALGYGSNDKCFLCSRQTSFAFYIKEQKLICENCSWQLPKEELLCIE